MGLSSIASPLSGLPEDTNPPNVHYNDDSQSRNANFSSLNSSPSSGDKFYFTSESSPSDDPEDSYTSRSRRRNRRSGLRSWLEYLTMGVTRRQKVVDEPLLVMGNGITSAGDGLLARASKRKISIRRRRKWYNYVIFCGISGLTILAILLALNLGLILATTLLYPPSTDPLQSPHYNFYTIHPPFTQDVLPIPCHSHNDYWRSVPLFGALHAGCISTEADVWLLSQPSNTLFSNKLYVGHNRRSLTPDRTFQNMYIRPLVRLLEITNPFPNGTETNGVFDSVPSQTFILLIDIKTSGPDTYPLVVAELEPLRVRGWLTFVENGIVNQRAVTVIGTGETPFDLLTSGDAKPGYRRDVFFDAPLERLWEPLPPTPSPNPTDDIHESTLPTPSMPKINTGQGMVGVTPSSNFTTQNSYYASVSFNKAVGRPWRGKVTDTQLKIIRGHVRGAHRRGLTVRYWGVPSWPRGLREHVWGVLVREGVEIIGVDDLEGVKRGLW